MFAIKDCGADNLLDDLTFASYDSAAGYLRSWLAESGNWDAREYYDIIEL